MPVNVFGRISATPSDFSQRAIFGSSASSEGAAMCSNVSSDMTSSTDPVSRSNAAASDTRNRPASILRVPARRSTQLGRRLAQLDRRASDVQATRRPAPSRWSATRPSTPASIHGGSAPRRPRPTRRPRDSKAQSADTSGAVADLKARGRKLATSSYIAGTVHTSARGLRGHQPAGETR